MWLHSVELCSESSDDDVDVEDDVEVEEERGGVWSGRPSKLGLGEEDRVDEYCGWRSVSEWPGAAFRG